MSTFEECVVNIIKSDPKSADNPEKVAKDAAEMVTKNTGKPMILTNPMKIKVKQIIAKNAVKSMEKEIETESKTESKTESITELKNEEKEEEIVVESGMEKEPEPEKELEKPPQKVPLSMQKRDPNIPIGRCRAPKNEPKFDTYTQNILSVKGYLKQALLGFPTNEQTADFPIPVSISVLDYISSFGLSNEIDEQFTKFDALIAKCYQGLIDQLPNTILLFRTGHEALYYKKGEKKRERKNITKDVELWDVHKVLMEYQLPPLPKFIKDGIWKTYLMTAAIHSVNVFEPKQIHFLVDRCYRFPKLEYYHKYEYDENDIKKIIPVPKTPQLAYAALLSCAQDINMAKAELFMKAVYKNRIGITSHPRLTEQIKKESWSKALANITAIDLTLFEEEDQTTIQMWTNILSSTYCYHIFMNAIEGSPHFAAALNHLLDLKLSLKLLCSSLYPISFIFTPFLAKVNKRPEVKNQEKICGIRKGINAHFMHYVLTDAFEACGWIGYLLNNTEEENYNIGILHEFLKQLEEPIKKPKKIKDKK
jgi:hypothetical protein